MCAQDAAAPAIAAIAPAPWVPSIIRRSLHSHSACMHRCSNTVGAKAGAQRKRSTKFRARVRSVR